MQAGLVATLGLTAALLVAAPTVAQAPPPGAPRPALPAVTKDPADAPAGLYAIDLAHSAVVARVLHHGTSFSVLRFGVTKGELAWDPAKPAAIKLDVTVDAKPHTDPIVYLFKPESAQFLDVARFPQITFQSKAVRPAGPGRADVEGDLTLMGVTKPAVIHAEVVGVSRSIRGAPTIGFTGTMRIKWSDFAKALDPALVGDDMALTLDGEFIKS